MRVSQLAKKLSVSPDSIRYYTRIGLLQPGKCSSNGYNQYSRLDESRLNFILRARRLSFSIEDITQILAVANRGESPCPLARELINNRLTETEKEFQQIVALRGRMVKAVNRWNKLPDKEPTGEMVCHLIENFDRN